MEKENEIQTANEVKVCSLFPINRMFKKQTNISFILGKYFIIDRKITHSRILFLISVS